MKKYKVNYISEVIYSPDLSFYWRKALLESINDPSDRIILNLNPHAKNEASGVLMIDDIPDVNYTYLLKEYQGKPLDAWEEGDLVLL